ncbi:MAG: D-glycero-beta-D-manno-heptose-7-phosphate kinase [Thermodesulfobacteriota bacterium]|nr:D-glycero-beta-D-manno-heptose-7-phosphate kinase [Thermodesulfobacteriota bacterium]
MPIDISKFDKCNLLVVGDLMLDEYLWGEVDRISPEAPVQVVSINNEDFALGGAGNVVNNVVALGAKVSAAGVIGSGKNGQILLNKFKELGVDTAGIVQEPGRTTTKKTRIIASHQHVLRIDRETDKAISDPTLEKITRFIKDKIADVDVVLISDYGKGLITKTLLSGLISAAKNHKKVAIADPKGLDFSKYSGVSLLTPNKKEAALASGVEIVDESTLFKAGNIILQKIHLDKLLITCGKDGMVLFEKNRSPCRVRAEARQVFDVSGAGDTVLAILGLAVASGVSIKNSVTVANTAAGIVVGKVGTATVSKQELASALKIVVGKVGTASVSNQELASAFKSDDDSLSSKYQALPELPALIGELKKKGKRLVLTNGCFDLLHVGHILLFSASKQLGDILIVAIDDDESITTLKGPGRPVIGVKERVRILCALDSVDYVVVFSSRELKKLIEIIQPDVLTKGSNYTSEEVFGRERVEQLGGCVVLIPVSENISSTRIINDIKSST